MGEVYRARHVKLGRDVAIKVLPRKFASDPERLSRFEREARTASALNHPNIVTIHDIAEQEGTTYIAMELVEGRTLRELLRDGPLPVSRAIELSIQIAEGLAKAHAAGIVHRDLKPDNLMVTEDGLVKILDFGLAKPTRSANASSEVPTVTKATEEGIILGTAHYMSPEQAAARPLDHRSDQFSFGVVLYELLSGARPFEGTSVASLVGAILRDPPRPLKSLRPDAPRELARIVHRCLGKEPETRYASSDDLRRELVRSRERLATGIHLRRPAVLAAVILLVVGLAAGTLLWLRGSGERWVENEALPEIARLIETGDLYQAYRLALEAEKYLTRDPRVEDLLARITLPAAVVTDPPDASVHVKGYSTPDAPWERLGRTPLQTRIPYALMRWKIEKDGFETFEGAPFGVGPFMALATGFPLAPEGTAPQGMVWVPGGSFAARPEIDPPGVPIDPYWLDRYEVTNEAFKAFVDAGGYETREYWTGPFLDGVRKDSWQEATATFRDATGRPGPAAWELGTYAEGDGDLPVGGVSWYEAAAYCAFAGKSLPAIYHWFQATAQDQLSDILRFSNFGTDGPAPVGSYRGLGDYGTYDMAGNVREWCWNADEDKRYILGGAWNEPTYMFKHVVAEEPFSRSATNGFRCAIYGEVDEALLDPVPIAFEYSTTSPVDDEVFEAYRGMYAYDPRPLEAEVESVDGSSPYWRKETVSFEAAYGDDERVTALLFLPRSAEPPYQTVVWFPGDDVFLSRSSESLASEYLFDFIPRSGRALVYPIYNGMYERFAEPFSRAPNEWRDRTIQWSKDLGRTLDYLETREDIADDKLAYYGFSSGASYGPIFTAIDDRFQASILLAGGLLPVELRPEMNAVHFAPRSRVPALMINGRDDYLLPFESSQLPLFDLLGAPDAEKRHARLEGGHIPLDRREIIKEALDWLDRHLGPVGSATTGTAAPVSQ